MYFAIGMIIFFGGLIFVAIKMKREDNEIKRMTDEELKRNFIHCAEHIASISEKFSCVSGVGSRIVASELNQKIGELQDAGKRYAKELTARGYTVDLSVLRGGVAVGKSKSSVIGSAIIGGIIAGGPGAVVGALHAAEKNKK